MKNINRIFLFGDSFVEGQGIYESIDKNNNFLEPDNLHGEELRKWRQENSWNKFIKERTDCEVINYARQGSDNYAQFGQLNWTLRNVKPTDLIIFGFTSKMRDSGFAVNYGFTQTQGNDGVLLHPKNPLAQQIAWEKNLLYSDRYCTDLSGHAQYMSENEKKITIEFAEDIITKIYNPQLYETIAQINYAFYQKWCKENNVNILFFDIFEKYIDEEYVGSEYEVDSDMYISYQSKSLTDVLTEYEIKNIKEGDRSIWEWGYYRPDLTGKTLHANQYGYKIFADYLFDNFLDKRYDFSTNPI
jgi:hypothetical protein